MPRHSCTLVVLFRATILLLLSYSVRAGLVLDDSLQGSTSGTRSGGSFVSGGWQVSTTTDTIYWHVPTITNGAVEFDVRGLYPNECRAGMEDKVELFHMYDFTYGNADVVYSGGYRDDPYKHFIRKTDCLDTTRFDSLEIVWQIAPNYTEPDTARLSWDPNTTYHFREEWGPGGAGNALLKVYRDGVLLVSTSVPGSWNPAGHSVRIAASPRRAADAGAPLGAIFSNVKVWNLASTVPTAPILVRPASNATLNTTLVFSEWLGDSHSRYQVRITRSNDPNSTIAWDSNEVLSDRNFAWIGPVQDQKTYFIFVRLYDAGAWGPWSANGRMFQVNTAVVPAGSNLVRVQGKSLADQAGPFLGLGASYFQALRRAKYDRTRLNSDLALLAAKGFNYVRILSMVNWDGLEIAPASFTNSAGHFVSAWPDYWQQFRDLLDLVSSNGLRSEVTIFADAQFILPAKAARQAHLDGILAGIAGREDKVIHLEVANEAWQNGFPGTQGVNDLREFTQYLTDRTSVPVAITSNADTTDAGIISLYNGSSADLATVHFSRDTGSVETGWLPVRDSYRAGNLPGVPPVSSNEPIGPGSSVSSENDPIKLCSAAAFAFIANLPAYVYHTRAGTFGYVNCCPPGAVEARFENMAGIDAFEKLRQILPADVSSWVRNDGIESSSPLTIFCNGQPNKYWPALVSPTNGCVRNIGSSKGNEFVCLPIGILGGGLLLETRRPLALQVINPLTGTVLSTSTLNTGSRFTLPQGPGAYLLKGTLLEPGTGCEPWIQFLDGSTVPAAPWQAFQSAGPAGTTAIVSFFDPVLGITNQALRINSGVNANEWFVGVFPVEDWAAAARFRLAAFTPTGKENLLCLTTQSSPLSPAPSITLVDGRFKLWSYVNSNTELLDLGPADTNQWHSAYLQAHKNGKIRLWWDGCLAFDGTAPLVNPYDGYVEWGSGSWQFDAGTTVDFDWVAYGDPCNLPQLLSITRAANRIVLSWPTNTSSFVLQSSTDLAALNWAAVTDAPTTVSGSYVVTNQLGGASRFFRLAR